MHTRTIRHIIEGQELLTALASTPVSEAAKWMQLRKVGAILVVERERLVGIFTERDALFRVVAEDRDPSKTLLVEVMTKEPTVVNPDQSFSAALNLMHVGQFRHVPVVENGRPIGIVSSRDAMGAELEDFMYSVILSGQARDILA